ncbi:MAG TPA: DNA cytosine methyltransferase [Acidimicrobiales bacterium]|nr:DNA cytosine methyltransferase [Acidimicrobiales bacterium]
MTGPYASTMQPPRMIDLFAGCGGMTAGFVAAGFEPVLAVEWELPAAATYAANYGEEHVFWGDIADLPEDRIPEADVVIGGPPCQGFSNLGSRNPRDPRNRLWREYVRVVSRARPAVFVIENVARFHSSHEFSLLEAEVAGGALRDYRLAHAVVNAADYGVPQRRLRTIVVGSRIGQPSLPPVTHRPREWVPVRKALRRVPAEPLGADLPASRDLFFGRLVPGSFKSAEIHVGRRPTPTSAERYRAIPEGGNRFDLARERPDLLPPCWRNKPTGTTDVMGRLWWDDPSVTIRTEFFKPEKGRYLHPAEHRPITHLEAARLQTFPDDYLWCGSKVAIARQIGNAVPSLLARRIAETVAELLVKG